MKSDRRLQTQHPDSMNGAGLLTLLSQPATSWRCQWCGRHWLAVHIIVGGSIEPRPFSMYNGAAPLAREGGVGGSLSEKGKSPALLKWTVVSERLSNPSRASHQGFIFVAIPRWHLVQLAAFTAANDIQACLRVSRLGA